MRSRNETDDTDHEFSSRGDRHNTMSPSSASAIRRVSCGLIHFGPE